MMVGQEVFGDLENDFQFFGVLSKKMALNKPGYSSEYIYDSNNNWISVEVEKKKKNVYA